MTNEEIVLKRLERKAKTPLHFKEPRGYDYWLNEQFVSAKIRFTKEINELKETKTVEDRVYAIFKVGNHTPTVKGNVTQCHAGANRSAQDIWRIYKYYFGGIDIFSIMRALYQLSVVYRKLNGFRCSTVQKQVFWLSNMGGDLETNDKADLGVALKNWEKIGL
jgi:hypothetical protein